jgi:hypothetical protein
VGPSLPSEETIFVTPGESRVVPVSSTTKWNRLVCGGPLSVIDYMNFHIKNRDEQIIGMSKLLAFAQRENGFPKGKVKIIFIFIYIFKNIFVNYYFFFFSLDL